MIIGADPRRVHRTSITANILAHRNHGARGSAL
jgi:hypothetical protein